MTMWRSSASSDNAADPDVVTVVWTTDGGAGRVANQTVVPATEALARAAIVSIAARRHARGRPFAAIAPRPAPASPVRRRSPSGQRSPNRAAACGPSSDIVVAACESSQAAPRAGLSSPAHSSAHWRASSETSSPPNARAARQHLVEHTAERPDVAALVGRAAPCLLRRSCRPRCRGSCPRRSSSRAT